MVPFRYPTEAQKACHPRTVNHPETIDQQIKHDYGVRGVGTHQ